MTRGQLRKALDKHPRALDDTLVILAKDEEGNGYSPLATIAPAMYIPLDNYHGTIVEMAVARDYDKAGKAALVFWPSN